MIIIIDYQMGNVGSIKNMLKYIGKESIISSKIEDIEKADKLILPGVGAFDNGIRNLKELIPTLNKKVVEEKTPILGICLGMQLMTKCSEEGKLKGLNWINAETKKFNLDTNKYRVPHMGWNLLTIKNKSSLFKNISNDSKFYFVHSYYVVCNDKNDIASTTNYGYEFTSSFQKDNIYGTQFHPEKSHKFGMEILKNFVENC